MYLPIRLGSPTPLKTVSAAPSSPVPVDRASTRAPQTKTPAVSPASRARGGLSLWDQGLSAAIRVLLYLARWLARGLSGFESSSPVLGAITQDLEKSEVSKTPPSSPPRSSAPKDDVEEVPRGRLRAVRVDSALADPHRSGATHEQSPDAEQILFSRKQARSHESLRSTVTTRAEQKLEQMLEESQKRRHMLSVNFAAYRDSAENQLAQAQQETHQVEESLKQAEARGDRLIGRMRQFEEQLEQARLEMQICQEELSELRARPAEVYQVPTMPVDANIYESSNASSEAGKPFARIRPPKGRKPWRP